MALNQSLCDNYIDIEFSTFIEVKGWMNIIPLQNINDANLIISINTDNLLVYKEEVPYGSSVEVSDPCDPTKKILVDNVMLNVAKIKGYLGYYIGAEVLDGNPDIEFGENNNPISLSNYVTAGDVCFIDNADFLILAPGEEAPTDFVVTVMQADIDNHLGNDTDDYVFSVSGVFRISPKPAVQS